jgi:hypothetical protein
MWILMGMVWLLDAALQFQPYMFSRDFAIKIIEPPRRGTPPSFPVRSYGQ